MNKHLLAMSDRCGKSWELFILAPRMLLARTALRGPQGRAKLLGRAAALPQSARRMCDPARDSPAQPPDEVCERKRRQACVKVQRGEVSTEQRAPGNEATWAALTDPTRRPPVPRTEVPPELLSHQPAQPVHLSARAVASALRSARRGGAPGLLRAEHLKLLLHLVNAIELLTEAATQLAQARVPANIPTALAMARLTALRKPEGGVQGIATVHVFRRLVSKTLAKQWAIYLATRPYQFAPQAPAGTDALAAHMRAALATRSDAVLVSLDGRSAYDTMSQAACLAKLRDVAPQLLPFVCMFYGAPIHLLLVGFPGQAAGHFAGERVQTGGCPRTSAVCPWPA